MEYTLVMKYTTEDGSGWTHRIEHAKAELIDADDSEAKVRAVATAMIAAQPLASEALVELAEAYMEKKEIIALA